MLSRKNLYLIEFLLIMISITKLTFAPHAIPPGSIGSPQTIPAVDIEVAFPTGGKPPNLTSFSDKIQRSGIQYFFYLLQFYCIPDQKSYKSVKILEKICC